MASGKSKSSDAREDTTEEAEGPRWCVWSVLEERARLRADWPDIEAAESRRGLLSLSVELARSLVPSCRATPRSPYCTLDTLRSRFVVWCSAIKAWDMLSSAACSALRLIWAKASKSPLALASRRAVRRSSRAAASLRRATRIWYRDSISSSRRASSSSCVSGNSTTVSMPPRSPSRARILSFSLAVGAYAGRVMTERTEVLRSTPAEVVLCRSGSRTLPLISRSCVLLLSNSLSCTPAYWPRDLPRHLAKLKREGSLSSLDFFFLEAFL